jgi:hypothetical protein
MSEKKQQLPPATTKPPQPKREWYKKWWGILFIIFCFPIGFPIFVWTGTKWHKGIKIAITIFFGLMFVIANLDNNQSARLQSENKQANKGEKQPLQPFPKKDVIKLNITQPEEESIEVTVDSYEIIGRVVSPDVAVNISNITANITSEDSDGGGEDVVVDSEGKFNLKVDLAKGGNVFNIIAKKGDEQAEKTLAILRKVTQEELNADLKAEAKTIPYKELFRNIEKYEGEKVYYIGEVTQVIGDGKAFSSMRVDITKGSYGIWDDTVLVFNLDLDADKVLEDDIIKFWGTVEGEESYETVLGATVSLPSISANIIELAE